MSQTFTLIDNPTSAVPHWFAFEQEGDHQNQDQRQQFGLVPTALATTHNDCL